MVGQYVKEDWLFVDFDNDAFDVNVTVADEFGTQLLLDFRIECSGAANFLSLACIVDLR